MEQAVVKKGISCVTAVYSAWDRMETILFRPFEIGKWFLLGFSAWLACIGQGMGMNFNFPSIPDTSSQAGSAAKGDTVNVVNQLFPSDMFTGAFLVLLIALLIAVIFISLVIVLILLWVRSRGAFVFLHDLATGTTEVTRPWREFSRQGNSLFFFRIVCGLIMAAFLIILIALTALMVFHSIKAGNLDAMGIGGIVFGVTSLLLVILTVIFLELSIDNFIIPLMFRKRFPAWAALGEFISLVNMHPMAFARFFLMYLLLSICSAVAVAVFVFSTCCFCCIGLILLSLPYIWAVVTLPILTFFRLYGVEFLGQFGEEYRIMPPARP
ncbi:MAG TPA: hypothetical protein DCZ94_06580 [Lentisphaeria bacterium]|nr:MAG: hypothetical protein A2X48_10800 [Lentisphaerae bacterium GWF2_49_21]HBC86601.1 hypothetical protein [Lentisphaeria bacterium]